MIEKEIYLLYSIFLDGHIHEYHSTSALGKSHLNSHTLRRRITLKIGVILLLSSLMPITQLVLATPVEYGLVGIFGNESILSNEASEIPTQPPLAEALALGSNYAYVHLGDNADTPQFTLEAWFRRDGTGVAISTDTDGKMLVPLITNGTAEVESAAADINYFFGISGSNDELCADFEEAQTGTSPGLNHPVCGTTAIEMGKWYHAAVTYDGTTLRLYLNGNLDGVLAVGEPANAENISHLGFGSSMSMDNTVSGYFDGTLDEVRIWNYPRTQIQIATTINTKLPNPQPGLIGRWGLDEGFGTIVADSSGYGINGTIIGTSYNWVPGSLFNAEVNLPPDVPVLVDPIDGSQNVSVPTALSVTVSDPENQPLDVTFFGRPLVKSTAGPDFTIIAIPDPQYYASTYPNIYNAQMQWIANYSASNNFVYVASLGDNVNNAYDLAQWTNAISAWNILDDLGLPYGLAAGNHDGAPSETGNFNKFFGVSRFSGKQYYGGHYESDNDNHYDLFTTSGLNFIVIFLEYDTGMTSTDHPVLVWANNLLQTYSERQGIVVSHSVLLGGTSPSFNAQGQTIYNVLKANPNLFLILGGHLDIAGRRLDTFNGNTVYTLRSDYQLVDNQQSGYLRIIRFSPDSNTIFVNTYSPIRDQFYPDLTNNNFSLPYEMGGRSFEVIGVASEIPSGGTANISWSGLASNEQYEWYAITSDGIRQTTSDTWNFTVGPNTYTLEVKTTGQGTVFKDPDQTSYNYGDTVELIANPAPGWSFSGWSGDLTGSENQEVITINGNKFVAATFSEDAYTLEVTTSGEGTVVKNPDQTSYSYGDTVQLTANPAPGWSFIGWTGDITGTSNPLEVRVLGNMEVAAIFKQNTYTLYLSIVSHGKMIKNPD